MKPDPEPPLPNPHPPWQSLMMGLPFRICAYDTETGVFRSAVPYRNVREILGLWGPTPLRVEDLGEVRELESYEAFPAWDVTAARSAAGVDQPSDPRVA